MNETRAGDARLLMPRPRQGNVSPVPLLRTVARQTALLAERQFSHFMAADAPEPSHAPSRPTATMRIEP